jgi:hypothetical protein
MAQGLHGTHTYTNENPWKVLQKRRHQDGPNKVLGMRNTERKAQGKGTGSVAMLAPGG